MDKFQTNIINSYKRVINPNIQNPLKNPNSINFDGSQKPYEFFKAWEYIDKFYTNNPTNKISFLEIGAYKGLWAIALKEYGLYKNIDIHYSTITLMSHNPENDSLKQVENFYKEYSDLDFDFKLINGSSLDEESKKQLPLLKYDIVFIDGDHSYESVMRDNELYIPLANDLVIWHDVVGKPGVVKALQDSEIILDETIFIEPPKVMGIGIKYIR